MQPRATREDTPTNSSGQPKRKGNDGAQASPDQPDHPAGPVQRLEVVRGEVGGWEVRLCDGQESLSNHTRLEDALAAAALRGEATGGDFLIVVRPAQTATLQRQHEDLVRPTLVLLSIGLLVFAFIAAFAAFD